MGKETVQSLSAKLQSEKAKLRQSIATIKKDLRFLDEEKAVAMMRSTEDRIAVLSLKVKTEVTKTCVVSEISRLWPELTHDAVLLLNNTDDYFQAREKFTLREWMEEIKADKRRTNSAEGK